MSGGERHRAALFGPDALPASKAQQARARRVPDVRNAQEAQVVAGLSLRPDFTYRSER
jgi:hypothetical protein